MMLSATIRPADENDRLLVDDLIQFAPFYHRHLDWIGPLEWLGRQPFWIIEHNGEAQAAFGCPSDPPGIAWIRLFVSRSADLPIDDWSVLLRAVLNQHALHPGDQIAFLGLHSWMIELAEQSGFQNYQNIVTLEWDQMAIPEQASIPDELLIRPIRQSDIPIIAEIDALAFAPLWRNSVEDIKRSLPRSSYASVVEYQGEIAGFQISTTTSVSAHLARLAVLPKFQKRSLGYALVHDLINHFLSRGFFRVTVNTQHDNLASLALYHKLGFSPTGEEFQVFTRQIEEE